MYKGGSDEYIAFGEANAAFTEIGIAKTKNGVEAYRFSSKTLDFVALSSSPRMSLFRKAT